jgi:hypothetical protein
MSRTAIVVHGVLKPDGTLELDEKIPLPAGRVQVIVQPAYDPAADPFWQAMEQIWAGQRARGHVPRSVEEVERERQAFREESEQEIQEALRIHEECRQVRQQAELPHEPFE